MTTEYKEDHIFYASITFKKEPDEYRVNKFVEYFYDIDYHFNENIVNVLYKPNHRTYMPNEFLFNFLKSYLDVATVKITLFNNGFHNPEIFELTKES